MKTSTKVILKFQLFSASVLALSLAIVNYGFFKLGLSQYIHKATRIEKNIQNMKGKGSPYRNWQKLNQNQCFEIYQQQYCLKNMQSIGEGIFKYNDLYFLVHNEVVLDITDFFELHRLLMKLSFYILLTYLILSYFLGRWFLQTIYEKIFDAIDDIKAGRLIDISKMNLSKDDELYLLFDTINQQMEALSSFNKYLSHEIKTPLMSILSSLELLKAQNKLSAEEFAKLKNEIFHIKNMIDMFGKFVFLEKAPLIVKTQKIDLCQQISDIAQSLNLKIKLECTYRPMLEVNLDLLKILLTNILTNAQKYSLGDVLVKVDKSEVVFVNPSNPIKNINKLSDKFYKESPKGMGIGLYLVKKITDLLDWKLSFDYQNNKFELKIKWN